MDAPGDEVTAWRPAVAGVAEVFHASWKDHRYPAHTHSTWTLLVVDDGTIGYRLDRRLGRAAPQLGVTLLPPHVPHDGEALTDNGFRKRVLYLDEDQLPAALIGRAVDAPLIEDAALRAGVSRLDAALVRRDDLEAESRLALVRERLHWHLSGRAESAQAGLPPHVARQARERFDADPAAAGSVTAVAGALGVRPEHLVRTFTATFGIPPHRYLLGRRLDLARRLLLDGRAAADVAVLSGFYDQAHLTRHFRRLLGTTPGRYGSTVVKNVQAGEQWIVAS